MYNLQHYKHKKKNHKNEIGNYKFKKEIVKVPQIHQMLVIFQESVPLELITTEETK